MGNQRQYPQNLPLTPISSGHRIMGKGRGGQKNPLKNFDWREESTVAEAAAVVAGGTPEAKARPGPGWKKKKNIQKFPIPPLSPNQNSAVGRVGNSFHLNTLFPRRIKNPKPEILDLSTGTTDFNLFFTYAFPTSSPTKPKQPLWPPTTENPSVVAIKSPRSNLNS